MIANSRPQFAGGAGEGAGPLHQSGNTQGAASADIVLVAVRWVDLGNALGGLPAWNGRIVIDAPIRSRFWTLTRRMRRIQTILLPLRHQVIGP